MKRFLFLSFLIAGLSAYAAEPARQRIAFMIGENEYDTKNTVPDFVRKELEPRGIQCDFAIAPADDSNEFPGLEKILPNADLLFISVRRRTPSQAHMDLIRKHVAEGRAVAGIRTASHAFALRDKNAKPPAGFADWPSFDHDVLGGNYNNHYGADIVTWGKVIPTASTHPVVRGIQAEEFSVPSHLYKNPDLPVHVTQLIAARMEGRPGVEPIAWVNTSNNRRVFYTSMGAKEDFKLPQFRRLLLNGILWSLNRPTPADGPGTSKPADEPAKKEKKKKADNFPAANDVPDVQQNAPVGSGPLSPAEAAKKFAIAGDLEWEQLLAEPIIRQPVFLNFDERGRMWVVEYRQYPNPAGLTMVSRDGFWRAVYDKVPPPPPHHFKGLDRITIHEDTKGNGQFDKHTTFVEGLNICTAVERGRGGVWVLNPPYLLFYPDKNNDDVPDGDPVVHLAGFGLEDTHSVANSLRWGPDGWLYGCQGSTVTASMTRPGLDKAPFLHTMGQLIWRYHPVSRRFEVFSEGGGNAFGCEMDSKGRIFSGHNGGNTRGFHYEQGAYLQKGFEKHGPLSNPYAYGYFPSMPHNNVPRFTHNFIIYDGGALPTAYRGKLFGAEPIQGRVVLSDITPDQSSFKTLDLSHPVVSEDRWFRPVDIKVGPDGAIYLCDWYDQQINHFRNHEGVMDGSNGRIYRLKAKGAKPGEKFDLGRLATAKLIELLGHSNKWFRQTALRLLADRRDASAVPMLKTALEKSDGQLSLEALWALNASGGLTEEIALKSLDHGDPFVRLWAIRFIGDRDTVPEPAARKLIAISRDEPNLETRNQLAATARRLPAREGLSVVRNLLLRDSDSKDNRMPLMLWWAIEAKVEKNRDEVVAVFEETALWDRALVKDHILEKVMRRFAQSGTRQDLLACARLFELSPSVEHSRKLMTGFELAYKGRSLAGLPDALVKGLALHGLGSVALGVRQGEAGAVEKALHTIADPKAKADRKLEYVQVLGEVKVPQGVPVLLEAAEKGGDPALRRAALTALQLYDEPVIGERVTAMVPSLGTETLPAAQSLLASRAAWARPWLQAVEAGRVAKESVPLNLVRRLKQTKDARVVELAQKLWPNTGSPTTAEIEKKIHSLAASVRGGPGDPYKGYETFQNACAACHTLYAKGGQIGPDLTTYKRDDLETMLLNIVNPSAEIREGYENHNVETRDGRSITGFLVEKDNQIVVLRGLDGQNITLKQDEIVEMKAAGMSLMPEGLLDSLKEQEVRDLFAYLRTTQPLVLKKK